MSEYSTPDYDLFVNEQAKSGVAIYTSKKLNVLECEELNETDFDESVWRYFTNANSQRVLAGYIHRSPSFTEANDHSRTV